MPMIIMNGPYQAGPTNVTTSEALIQDGNNPTSFIVDWDEIPSNKVRLGWTCKYTSNPVNLTARIRVGGAPAAYGPAGTIAYNRLIHGNQTVADITGPIAKPAGRKYFQISYQALTSHSFSHEGLVTTIIADAEEQAMFLLGQAPGGVAPARWYVDFDKLHGSDLRMSFSCRLFSIPPYVLTPTVRVRIGGTLNPNDGTIWASVPVGAASETTPDGAIVGVTMTGAKPSGLQLVKIHMDVVSGFMEARHASVVLRGA
jgi:hypothetical protein